MSGAKKASQQTVVCPNPLASSSRVPAQGPHLRPAGWQRATSGLVQLVSKLKGQVVGSVLSLWLLLPETPRELMEEMALEDMMTAVELGKPGWGWRGEGSNQTPGCH